MSAQERTLKQYHELMRINSVSHVLRAARELGLFDQLANGQRTSAQLIDALSLQAEPTGLLLDALVATGIIEKYDDDYALSQAAQLLCQYDDDLGDQLWSQLVGRVKSDAPADGDRLDGDQLDAAHHRRNAATQWVHTASAIQAAEILNIGGEDELAGPKILDLGCGSAVWSCAMAHQDAAATVTAVDQAGALIAATTMADSIDLDQRFQSIEGDPLQVDLPSSEYDIVVLAQRLHALDPPQADRLLQRAITAAAPGGRIVVIDLFRGPTKPTLAESIQALKLDLETKSGKMRTLEAGQTAMVQAGLECIQFSFLAASDVNLGLMVGVKPLS